MARATFRGRDCQDLLVFEEVQHRLRLGTRLSAGRHEVPVADIVGSVDRARDFDGCFRPRTARLRREIEQRSWTPGVIDQPISLIQVDHAYFVEDGHKRLSLAIAAGRQEVDADVDRFETELHVAPGTTMDSVRATARERRFREVTGLDVAVPHHRFALSDPDSYLELEESVKAHTLDLSFAEGKLLTREDGARHWYDTVFRPVLDIAEQKRACRLLESTTEADRFLLFRRGFEGPMDIGWRLPASGVERGLANIDAGLPARRKGPLARLTGKPARPPVQLLPEESEASSERGPDQA